MRPLDIVVLGLSLSSSWGNGHATTYRALLRGLAERGHRVQFLERTQPWYRDNRDVGALPYCKLRFYSGLADLKRRHRETIAAADVVIVGSYVPEGVEVGRFVQAAAGGLVCFYDIDTPVTLDAVRAGDCAYLTAAQIASYDLYLSFTGGPMLQRLVNEFGARRAEALYCSVDIDVHAPRPVAQPRYELGYLGTYSDDRQEALGRLLLQVARLLPTRRFVVAGALYPPGVEWPANVERVEHVAPGEHAAFYGACRHSLNLTRAPMRLAGFSPSVRLFEAAACNSALVSDDWPGLDTFFARGSEIVVAERTEALAALLAERPEEMRRTQTELARRRVLSSHTGAARAAELEALLVDAIEEKGLRAAAPNRLAAVRPLGAAR